MESLTDIAPPYQRQDLPLDLQSSQHLLRRRLLRFYALIPTPFYPPPNFLPYPLCRTQENRAAPPLPPPSPCKKPHGPIPLALAPPPARLPTAPFSTPAAPDDPLSPSSAVAPSSDSPNAETSRTTSCAKPPHPASYSTTPPPPLSSETASPNLRSCSCVHTSGPTP